MAHSHATTILLTFNALPVARCKSAIALFRSVCAFNSKRARLRQAVCRSNTRNVVDCPASSFRCSLANCCSFASRVATAARKRASGTAHRLQCITNINLNCLLQLLALRSDPLAFNQRRPRFASAVRLRKGKLICTPTLKLP